LAAATWLPGRLAPSNGGSYGRNRGLLLAGRRAGARGRRHYGPDTARRRRPWRRQRRPLRRPGRDYGGPLQYLGP
jgi:hypothetical protein